MVSMKKKLAIALPLVFLSFQIWAQENPQSDHITTKLAAYISRSAPEKIYLHTDKDLYAHDETIWFKAYLINGVNHTISNKSKVIYVELLDSNDNLIVQRKLYFNGSGASGDIKVDGSFEEGDYNIRAYTKYMLNEDSPVFFQKEISILKRPIPTSIANKTLPEDTINRKNPDQDVRMPERAELNVRFFPEGGDLVTGLQSVMGLKITDGFGNGIILKGNIIDEEGNGVNSFQTHEFGLGAVSITPKKDTRYYADISVDGISYKIPVPKALDNGYVVQLKNRGSQILIKISTTIGQGLNGSLLLGHIRGEVFLKHSVHSYKNSYTISIPTSILSDGVAHFTLFDPKGAPRCERLTFIDNPDNATDLTLKTGKADYRFREKVEIDLSLVDAQRKPLQGDFSISVALDNSLLKNTPGIKSWLLLNSDMGNTIENPNYFFGEDSTIRKNSLDILMLTHGWRRFVWKSFLTDDFTKIPKFLPEKGIMINGRTTALGDPYQAKKSTLTLSILGPEIYQEKITTDDQGKFSFGPFVFQDSVRAIINATAPSQNKKGNSDLAVHIDSFPSTVNIADSTGQGLPKKTVVTQADLEQEYRDTQSDFEYSPEATALSEVIVTAKKKTRKERIEEELNKMTLYGSAQNRLFPDSIPGLSASSSVFDIIRQVAGVQVTGTSVRIRGITSFTGGGDPLFTVDGVPVSPDFIQTLTVQDILFVDVLKGNEAAIYGARGTNGVIALYTDRGRSFEGPQEKHPYITSFVVQGFYRAREFHSPDYGVKKPDHHIPDRRTTLYWNPEIKIEGETPTKLYFYTADVTGKYTITVEGISTDGNPVSEQYSFHVFE